MTAASSGSSTRRWARVAAALSLTVSLVAIAADPALAAADTYRDNFDSGFSGNDGTPFATDWLESGESDGPGAGGIKVETELNCASGSCLTLGRLATGGGNVSVEREIDLSLASSATLQFDYKRHDHLGVSGQAILEVSADGSGDWDPLQTWDLSVTDLSQVPASFDISSYTSVDTRIRFRLINDTDQSHLNIDNLVITADNDLSPYNGGVVINEVLFDQTPGVGGEEFVELFNATAGPVALDGWDLQVDNENFFYTFPPGVSLAPGEYAVVWADTVDPGGLRDAPAAAFQDGAGQGSNPLGEAGGAMWLLDNGGLRVDFVAWGIGIPSPPPEWDRTYESSIDGSATARGQSISLTPNGIDGNDSACWEPTTSGDAAGRCAGVLPTSDFPPAAQLWSPGVSNQAVPPNQPPVFDQDLLDRSDPEGTLFSISAGATDPDLNTLTYSATGLPEGISLNPGTGLITGALGPNAAGAHAVTITVTDDGIPNEQDVDTFTWTVTAGEVAYLIANIGGGNGGDDQLTAVDLTDPNPATNEINIGTGTGTWNIESAALQPGTDILFAIENDQVGTIDITAGTFAALPSVVGSGNGAVGFITFDNIESLTFNPFTGHLYASHRRGLGNADVLFRLDPTSGAAIPGVFGGDDYVPLEIQFPYHHAADLAFDPTDGQLYAIHWDLAGNWSIATVDPATGATVTVGAIPQNVHGLAFDGGGGLWATTADTPDPYFLYQLDKTDGSVISTATIDNGTNYEAIAISFPFNPNQPAAFDEDLLDRSDPEGSAISIPAGATDPDIGDVLLYSASGLPPGLAIDPNSGLISGSITYAATGTYPVTLSVTDDGIPNLGDTDTFTWTITEANRAPVFDEDLLDRSDPEGAAISLSAGASDPDAGDALLYAASGLPAGVSIDPGSGLISGTLTFTSAGSYSVNVTVTDDGSPNLTDADPFTWTVANTNRPPVMVNPGAQTTPELSPFSLVVTASDPDLAIPTFGDGGTLPAWATLTDNGDGTATITGTPGGGDSTTTTVTITASDGSLTDDAVFDLTVTNTNLPPVIVNPGNQTGAENTPFTLTVTASDPDTTIPSLTATGLPTWAGFTDNGDGTATITGTPGYEDAATTTITITATDGALIDNAVFTLTITNTNRPPVANPVPDQTVAEADPLAPLSVTATDPDTTIPSLSASGLPGWAGFTDNGDGTATITGTPGYEDAASSLITITATDGTLTDDTSFTLMVTNTNRPPAVNPIADQSVAEAISFLLMVSASDPDLTVPFLNVTGLPAWAGFTDNGDGTASITGTPGYDDAATTTITITATDDAALSATRTFTLTVTNTNRPPVTNPIADQTVAEADPFGPLVVTATDPDLTTPALSAAGLPGWAGFTDNGDGTATITGTPGYDDDASSLITITATDGTLTDDTSFTLTVTNTNRPPVVDSITDQTVAENTPFSLVVTASDPDLTIPTLTAGGLPIWAGFTDNGDGTASITGTPGYDDAASSLITITATDDDPLSATGAFTLTVTNTNLPPVIVNPGNQTGAENNPFTLTVMASDPDTTIPSLTATGLPTWAGFTDNGDGTATITGTPGYEDAATTTITITATDGALADNAVFDITITSTNRPPVLDPIADQSVAEADAFSLTVTASDPDVTIPTLTAGGLPTWAGFTDNGDGTATITGTPGYEDAGSSLITITASDGALTDNAVFDIDITNTNRPPTVDAIADQTVAEADPFSLTVTASDPDLTVPFLNVTGLHTWAGFTDNGDGTATITGTPGYEDAGSSLITITASDGTLTDDTTLTLTVTNTNQAPTAGDDALLLPAEAAYTVFSVLANDSDPDGDDLAVGSFDPTTVGTLSHEGDGTFRYVPGPGAPYAESFTYTVEDPAGAASTATVFISVSAPAALPPLPPVVPALVELGPLSGSELAPVYFTAAVTVEADVVFSLIGAPAGSTIDPATGSFSWTPTEADGPGAFSFVVRLADVDTGAVLDEAIIELAIAEVDSPPSLRPVGFLATEPGSVFSTVLTADDPDLPAQTPRFEWAGPAPAGASIDPRSGEITWNLGSSELIGQRELAVRVRDAADPSLFDEMTVVVTVGAVSSSDRKAALIAQLIAPTDSARISTPVIADQGIPRTLVIMARAGMGSARALGTPFLLLLLLTIFVLSVGRINLHPLLGRSRRMEGTVAWFDGSSGYGFIIPDESAGELFLHRSALARGETEVVPGARVSFRVVKGGQRSFALRVKGVE